MAPKRVSYARPLLAAAVLLTSLVLHPAPGSGTVSLAGVTRISGSRPGTATAYLAAPVPLTNVGPRLLDIRGAGRFIGLLMILDDPSLEFDARPRLFGGRVARCSEPACDDSRPGEPSRPSTFVDFANLPGEDGPILPQGQYKLYLVADGSPATVTLHLAGLEGEAELSATGPVATELRSLTARTPAASPVARVFGDFSVALGTGISLVALWAEGSALFGGGHGFCRVENRPPQELTETAFHPPCPWGKGTDDVLLPPQPGESFEIGATLTSGQVPSGLGAWFSSLAPPERVGAIGLWLPVEGA